MTGMSGSGRWRRGRQSGSGVAERTSLRDLVDESRCHVGVEGVPARARALPDTLEPRSMWTDAGSLQVWAGPMFCRLSQFMNDAHWCGMC